MTSRKRIRLDPSASPPIHGSDSEDTGWAQTRQDNQRKHPNTGDFRTSELNSTLGHQNETTIPSDVVEEEDQNEDHCVICLQGIQDRTILPCAHDRLCFNCILLWCEQSRKCPLCNASVGEYLIHNFRSKYDYSKYYLHPLASSPLPASVLARFSGASTHRPRHTGHPWGRRRQRSTSRERADALELAISRRRWVYHHELYAKHVASNPYTRYKPCPAPAQISTSSDILSRATIFIRRELRVWINLDVEFLTSFILSLMKSLDLRSEPAIKLLAEFLDMDTPYYIGNPDEPSRGRFRNAEHFAHELYSYLRAPFRDLAAYDTAVEYDVPADLPPAPAADPVRQGRWENRAASPLPHANAQRPSRSPSRRSPSPGGYSPSPTRSHDYEDLYLRHERVRGSRGGRSEQDHPSRLNNRDKSGRHQNVPHSGPDARPREGDNQSRLNKNNEQYNYSPSRRHDVQQSRNDTPALPSARRNSFHSSASLENDDRHDGDYLNRSAEPRTKNNTRNNQLKKRQRSRASSSSVSSKSHESPGAVPMPDASREPIRQRESDTVKLSDQSTIAAKPALGISIKGQAKLLAQKPNDGVNVFSAEPYRAMNRTEEGERGGTINTGGAEFTSGSTGDDARIIALAKRQRSAADLLHAHLLKGSTRLELGPEIATVTGASSTNNEEDEKIKFNKKSSSTLTSGCDVVNENNISSNQLSQVGPAATADVGPRTHGISAQEIMARTRARLAKLRIQNQVQTLIDVVPGASSSKTSNLNDSELTSSGTDMRTRLLQRLEDAKRSVLSGPAPGASCDNENEEEKSPLSEVHVDAPSRAAAPSTMKAEKESQQQNEKDALPVGVTIGQSKGGTASSEAASETMEKRLRAQALLRVRLAAEKKKAGNNNDSNNNTGRLVQDQEASSASHQHDSEGAATKEDALRTHLLSRRRT